jgi:hypothetical protein
MLFRPVALVSSVLFAQAALAALTPDQVVTNIGIVTTVSGDLNSILNGLTTSSSGPDAKTMQKVIPIYWVRGLVLNCYAVQTVTTDFQTIITNLDGDVNAMQATPPFADDGAVLVANALTDVSGHCLIGLPN